MVREDRFRALRDGAVIRLFGCATHESSPQDILRDLCDMDFQVYDLTELRPGTWVGMRALRDAMVNNSLSVVLRSACRETHLQLRVLDSDDPSMAFETAMLPFVDSGRNDEHEVMFDEVELDTKGFGRWGDDLLLGYGPMITAGARVDSIGLDEADRGVLRYCQFAEVTVLLACAIIDSIATEVQVDVERLKARMEIYDRVLPRFDDSYQAGVPVLERFTQQVARSLEDPRARIWQLRGLLRGRIARVQNAVYEERPRDVRSAFAHVGPLIRAITELAESMERCGVAIGEAIGRFGFRKRVWKALERARAAHFEGEALEDIRDDFEIMDIEGEDSWEETHALLVDEYSGFVDILDEFFTTLQGFDRARQILEHRRAEFEAIAEQVPSDNRSVLATLEAISELAHGSLVTDQEALAYRLFLTEESADQEGPSRAPPGDIILF